MNGIAASREGIALGAELVLEELVSRFGGELLRAEPNRRISRLRPPGAAHAAEELVLVARASMAPQVTSSAPALVLCTPDLAPRLVAHALWVHAHVMWVVASLLSEATPTFTVRDASEPAVSPQAELGRGVRIAHGAVVYPGVVLGDGCSLGENAVVYPNVRVGARSAIGAGSVLGRPGFGWAVGPRGQVLRMPHPGGLEVGSDVEVGALCTLDAGVLAPTRIGDRTKLDAHVHVAHNVVIGSDCFVAAQAGFAGSVSIGPQVMVGGQAGVADHREIGRGARLAAQAGVISDVPPGATYAGYPALPRGVWLRAWAALRRQGSK